MKGDRVMIIVMLKEEEDPESRRKREMEERCDELVEWVKELIEKRENREKSHGSMSHTEHE